MKDWIARAVRTFLQAFVGTFVLFYVGPLQQIVQDIVNGGEMHVDLNFWRNALFACAVAGFIALVSLAQNWLEDTSGKALLKPPSPPAPADVQPVAKV
jgi:hypothetical protein